MSNNEPEKKNDAVEEDYGIPSPQQPWTVGKVFGMVKQASQRVVIATKDIDEKYQVSAKTMQVVDSTGKVIKDFDEKHLVTAKTKEALASTGNAIKDFDQKNQITTKTKQGVQQGASYVFGSGKGGGSGGPGGQTGP